MRLDGYELILKVMAHYNAPEQHSSITATVNRQFANYGPAVRCKIAVRRCFAGDSVSARCKHADGEL